MLRERFTITHNDSCLVLLRPSIWFRFDCVLHGSVYFRHFKNSPKTIWRQVRPSLFPCGKGLVAPNGSTGDRSFWRDVLQYCVHIK